MQACHAIGSFKIACDSSGCPEGVSSFRYLTLSGGVAFTSSPFPCASRPASHVALLAGLRPTCLALPRRLRPVPLPALHSFPLSPPSARSAPSLACASLAYQCVAIHTSHRLLLWAHLPLACGCFHRVTCVSLWNVHSGLGSQISANPNPLHRTVWDPWSIAPRPPPCFTYTLRFAGWAWSRWSLVSSSRFFAMSALAQSFDHPFLIVFSII